MGKGLRSAVCGLRLEKIRHGALLRTMSKLFAIRDVLAETRRSQRKS